MMLMQIFTEKKGGKAYTIDKVYVDYSAKLFKMEIDVRLNKHPEQYLSSKYKYDQLHFQKFCY